MNEPQKDFYEWQEHYQSEGYTKDFSHDQFNALWGFIAGFQDNGKVVDSITIERGYDGCMIVDVAPLWVEGSVIISKDANVLPQLRMTAQPYYTISESMRNE